MTNEQETHDVQIRTFSEVRARTKPFKDFTLGDLIDVEWTEDMPVAKVTKVSNREVTQTCKAPIRPGTYYITEVIDDGGGLDCRRGQIGTIPGWELLPLAMAHTGKLEKFGA